MSSPSQPINIRNQRGSPEGNTDGISSSFTPSVGTPNLNAFRAQFIGTPTFPNIPPRGSTPQRTGSPAIHSIPLVAGDSSPRRPAGFGAISTSFPKPGSISASPNPNAPNLDFESLTEEDKARVLRKHLVSKDERARGKPNTGTDLDLHFGAADAGTSRPQSIRSSYAPEGSQPLGKQGTDPFPVPYDAPGADVTHDIYKWHSRQSNRARAVSFHAPAATTDPVFEHIHEPGGFRRNYMKLRATEQGSEEPPMLDNFIDFLTLFGHFAGEDLEDDEEEKDTDEEEAAEVEHEEEQAETTPLIRSTNVSRTRSRSRRRRGSVGPQGTGTATVTQAVLMLLKSFIGTGVLFLGKAFLNGGILFSSLMFAFIAIISLYSFLLLLDAKLAVPGSFGDIGGILYGPWMRYTILGSIVISQVGFVAAYTIFVAENLQAFVLGITDCLKLIPVQYFILAQLVVFVPLALVRDIAKLSSTALIADVFIFAGLGYIFKSELGLIAERGIAPDIKLFNHKDFPLFIGTAVFSFEGIGLVIPISDAMREPHKLPIALSAVMAFLVVLFGGSGILAYLTFGSEIQTVVLVNLDLKSRMVQTVQFFYALAILLSVPLQLFPAVRILENGIFSTSGKGDSKVKWYKNLFRFGMVVLCSLISWAGAADLDKFVAFVGSFACVPLCYVYPAMLHYKACARTRRQKLADIAMIVFGVIAAVYTTTQTIKLMVAPDTGPPPFRTCDV
ncbi:vacuolar amino acid transporter 4 [Coprinopsis marcescibilis]|uniref:Vacuolar amino acid transporter 4 n=1 Tax=Coprinopsis marcescibilis TaxID=230819 RepID=A0A5C3L6K1_COPMA|nr:vacuolar amino acid transporter 4 [Coprinopsis marcescibilis]